jgi:hypothetical protein
VPQAVSQGGFARGYGAQSCSGFGWLVDGGDDCGVEVATAAATAAAHLLVAGSSREAHPCNLHALMSQEVAQGRSLADMVASGWRADEAEVTRIATELLDILGYLGARRPPVIHRWGRGAVKQCVTSPSVASGQP